MSVTVPIENVGTSPARKYGQVIQPGEKIAVEQDALTTYSVMEIARDLHTIAQKLSSIEGMMAQQREEKLVAKLRNENKTVNVNPPLAPLKVETTPWIVRVIQDYRRRRKWQREYKERRQNVRN